MQNLIEIR